MYAIICVGPQAETITLQTIASVRGFDRPKHRTPDLQDAL
jgi:hypothetical protein